MQLTITDNYTAIPVWFSPEDNEFLVEQRTDYFFHCDCHNLVWHHKEMVVLDLENENYWRCDLPIETAL